MVVPECRAGRVPGGEQAVTLQGGGDRLRRIQLGSVKMESSPTQPDNGRGQSQPPQQPPPEQQHTALIAVSAIGHPGVDFSGESVNLGRPAGLQNASRESPNRESALPFPPLQSPRRHAGIDGDLFPAVQTPPLFVGHASHDGRGPPTPASSPGTVQHMICYERTRRQASYPASGCHNTSGSFGKAPVHLPGSPTRASSSRPCRARAMPRMMRISTDYAAIFRLCPGSGDTYDRPINPSNDPTQAAVASREKDSLPVQRLWPAGFAAVLFAFFLPFLSVSCPGMKVTLSGTQVATGTSVDGAGRRASERIPAEPLAAAALGCAAVGLLMTLVKGRLGQIATAVGGGVGAAALIMPKHRLDTQALREGGGAISVQWEFGYWIALVGFVAVFLTAMTCRLPKHRSNTLTFRSRDPGIGRGSGDCAPEAAHAPTGAKVQVLILNTL